MDERLIARINELAHKSKTVGLTEEERQEQNDLRAEYLVQFRRNLRASLNRIDIEYPDGRVVSLQERHDEKYDKEENEQ